jgi:hypothetical protein
MMLLDTAGAPTPRLQERYAALGAMQPGIRRYNMFWSGFETVPSSDDPQRACPAGSERIPATSAERARDGFHHYHCYVSRQLRAFDSIFALDKKIGAQNAAIIYSAPSFYRHTNCTGFKFGKDWIKGGCIPTPEAMDDYEDFVNMLASRYSHQSTAPNKLGHFIVWNEVASAGWMDCSPMIPNRAGPAGSNPLTPTQFQYWVSRYAELVNRTALAVRRHNPDGGGVMIWTSNDRLWERPVQQEGEPLHTGVQPFLDILWPMLAGLNMTWYTRGGNEGVSGCCCCEILCCALSKFRQEESLLTAGMFLLYTVPCGHAHACTCQGSGCSPVRRWQSVRLV